jgi:hypothetical protein
VTLSKKKFRAVVHYLEYTWLGTPDKDPKFEKEWWNVFRHLKNSDILFRANCGMESYNRHFASRFPESRNGKRVSLKFFMQALKREESFMFHKFQAALVDPTRSNKTQFQICS